MFALPVARSLGFAVTLICRPCQFFTATFSGGSRPLAPPAAVAAFRGG